jgi:hypothetical protein
MKKKELFGEIAVRLEFVKPKDVEAALKIQEEAKVKKNRHRLIGLIMLQMGVLGNEQLIEVLRVIENRTSKNTPISQE